MRVNTNLEILILYTFIYFEYILEKQRLSRIIANNWTMKLFIVLLIIYAMIAVIMTYNMKYCKFEIIYILII